MLLSSTSKRLFIFAYYDADGIVDDYVIYLLRSMQAFCEKQIVIVNGCVRAPYEARLRRCCTELVMRENAGYDVSAYKEAFLSVPQEELEQYDEILFYNQTVFGPVYPLDEMFSVMAQRDVDFWGLTRHSGAEKAAWDITQTIPTHLQSYLFAVRKPMFTDSRFRDYWTNLPKIETYWDAVGKHEVLFTKIFADYGFSWQAYIDTEALEQYNDYPLMGMPVTLLQTQRCPFVKRKNFLCKRHEYSTVPQGGAGQALYQYLSTQTRYPTALIWQNLLRTADISTITSALTPYYDTTSTARIISGAVLVLWFAQESLAEQLCNAAKLQKAAKLYCLFATPELQEQYQPLLPNTAVCEVTSEDGAVYLFGPLWKELQKYTYVGYLHNNLPILLEKFADATTLSIIIEGLAGPGAAALLLEHPEIGLVVPPAVRHQENYYNGQTWPTVAENIKERLAKAGINVPLGEKKPGLYVPGGMFVGRVAALKPLANYEYDAATFVGQNEAWPYLPPLAAQASGYLTVFSCTAKTAYNLLANTEGYLSQLTAMWATPRYTGFDRVSFRMQAILDFYYNRRFDMTLEQAFEANLSFKQKLWIALRLFAPGLYTFLHERRAKNLPPPVPPEDVLD